MGKPRSLPAAGRSKRPLPEDIALFRRAVADAVPLVTDKVHHEMPPPLAIPRQRQQERGAAAALGDSLAPLETLPDDGDELSYLKPGLPRTVLRDLRRGRWVTRDQLDLHGLNRDEARDMLGQFLLASLTRGHRCLRIVHGKGLRSPGREPVLKQLVKNWLASRPEVLAYCQAQAADGGSGAVVVLLKAAR